MRRTDSTRRAGRTGNKPPPAVEYRGTYSTAGRALAMAMTARDGGAHPGSRLGQDVQHGGPVVRDAKGGKQGRQCGSAAFGQQIIEEGIGSLGRRLTTIACIAG